MGWMGYRPTFRASQVIALVLLPWSFLRVTCWLSWRSSAVPMSKTPTLTMTAQRGLFSRILPNKGGGIAQIV